MDQVLAQGAWQGRAPGVLMHQASAGHTCTSARTQHWLPQSSCCSLCCRGFREAKEGTSRHLAVVLLIIAALALQRA